MKTQILASILTFAASTAFADSTAISGDYLEVRSCDVYTGSCFANAEMNLAGKEGMMFWSVREGAWNGVDLKGLGVLAIVKANASMGNLKYEPRSGEAVLIVDAKASLAQREALADFAQHQAGSLAAKVVAVRTESIESKLGTCSNSGCASLTAGNLVQVSTSCLGGKHDICGNEETFYPPLSKVSDAYPVFTDLASFTGEGLDLTWQIAGKRSAFLATFSASSDGKKLALNAR